MIQFVYSVYDKKNGMYGPVMVFNSNVDCIRAMEMDLMRHDSVVANYPFDFCLHCLGKFDTHNGLLTADKIENIYEFGSFVRDSENK
nr:MAG TPA: DNA binding protein [Microviridae sp.]